MLVLPRGQEGPSGDPQAPAAQHSPRDLDLCPTLDPHSPHEDILISTFLGTGVANLTPTGPRCAWPGGQS